MRPSNALGVAAAFALTDKAAVGLLTTGSPGASRVLPAEQITQWLFAAPSTRVPVAMYLR